MTGEGEIADALERALRAIPGALSDSVDAIANDIRTDVSRPGMGAHSPDGSTPFLQSGELAAGIRGTSSGTEGQISSHADHSQYLEYGTSEMAPRPFFRHGVLRGTAKHLQPKLSKAITEAERKHR